MALALFSYFRVYFEAGSDPAHASTAGQFTDDVSGGAGPAYGQYVQNIFEMKDSAGAFTTRERGLFGIHWINTTGGALDTTWNTADYTSVESAVQTFWNAVSGWISSEFRLVEHRWYPFGPGVVKPNPPSRVTTIGTPLVGGTAAKHAHQMAQTVTLRTPLRRHWGRFYVPANTIGDGTGGQATSADVDTFATAARTMLAAPGSAQGVVPVVWDRLRKRAYGVTSVEADSVPDVIRRRRPRTTGYKKIISS